MEKFLSPEEVNELIEAIKLGNNDAWEKLYKNFDKYIHTCSWSALKKCEITADSSKSISIEKDLHMAGWQGFVSAIKSYDPGKGKFLTYATHYITGEISKELNLQLNPMGLTERPRPKKNKDGSNKTEAKKLSRISIEAANGGMDLEIAKALIGSNTGLSLAEVPNKGDYSAERRVLQILDVLRMLTDEKHTLSREELGKLLTLYRIARYENSTSLEADNTFNKSIAEILLQLNPPCYSRDNDRDYQIKYDGYEEDHLNKKVKMKKDNSQKVELAPTINGISYVHTFNYKEMDSLIQLISFSDMLSEEEKSVLIDKLMSTAGLYYKSPFWDGESLKFNPKAIHGRFSQKNGKERAQIAESIKIIQKAINNLGQIRFCFNRYNFEHEMESGDKYVHELSPYHLVVYHDNYYCIGIKNGDERIWHYRVDLMSDIEIVRDERGKIVPIKISQFEGLPICNALWDPEKYMAEHLNMAYDKPQDIRIKIRNTDYTILHDWFGNHYEKTEEVCGEGYDVVAVKTSPSMIVHWAMQYGTRVEIMEEEIRKKIREESEKVRRMYDAPRVDTH